MENKIKLLTILIKKFNQKYGTNLFGDQQLYVKTFIRKQFSFNDIETIFKHFLTGNVKIENVRNNRKMVKINNVYKMVICSDGYILSISDKRNSL